MIKAQFHNIVLMKKNFILFQMVVESMENMQNAENLNVHPSKSSRDYMDRIIRCSRLYPM